MIKLIAACAALSMFAVPAVAATDAGDRQTVVVSVPLADTMLDADGIQRVESRVVRAIEKACLSGDDELKARLSPDWQCRRELRHNAAAKLAALRQVVIAATASDGAITR